MDTRLDVICLLQSNFYLEEGKDQGHLQPIICDLCDQGQVASHMCTKCQMKLCFHCHRVHSDSCLGSAQGKAVVTSDGDVGKLLETGKSQTKIMEKVMAHILEDEKELHKQRKSLEDTLRAQYNTGLAGLADAYDEILKSIRRHTEAKEDQFKTEISVMQKKLDALACYTSQGGPNSVSSAEVQSALLSDSDVVRLQERVDQARHPEFFRHKADNGNAVLLVKSLQKVVFGTLEMCSNTKDVAVVGDASGTGDFDPHQMSSNGDPPPRSEGAPDSMTQQPHIDVSSGKTKGDDLAQKVEFLMKKFTESESQGRKLHGENRSLLEEVGTFRDKNSILVQDVASLQVDNGKLWEDVSKLQTGIQTLSQDYTGVLKQSTNLSSNFADLQKNVHSLQTERKSMSRADVAPNVKTEVDALLQESRSLKTDLSFSQGQIRVLQQQVQSVQDSVKDKAQRSQITRLESKMGELPDRCAHHFIVIFVVVAQLVEHLPGDPMDSMSRGSNPVRSIRKIGEFFQVRLLCWLVVGVPHPCVYMHAEDHTHVKDPVVHVRVRWMPETRKHCTQGKTKKLGCAVL